MYNQNVVMYINDFVNKSISEISRITNLQISEIPGLVENTKKKIIASLKSDFGPFLADSFHKIEEIIDNGLDENIGQYPAKLHNVEKLIINQLRRIEIEMQGALSTSTNADNFKTVLIALNTEQAKNLVSIEKSNSNDALKAASLTFMSLENQVTSYFASIGLTNESLCSEIRQIIDIHEYNLLCKIDDKIPAMVYTANDINQSLFNTTMVKLVTAPAVNHTVQNETPDIPMYKM